MGSRPPLRGFNHNIRYRNRVYHVQTEDSGLTNPHVFTHLFLEGQIISSARGDYEHLVEDPDNEQKVRKLMQEQHKSLMKQLRRGDFDEKIVALMGSVEPVEIGVEIPAGMAEQPPAEQPAAPDTSEQAASEQAAAEPAAAEQAPLEQVATDPDTAAATRASAEEPVESATATLHDMELPSTVREEIEASQPAPAPAAVPLATPAQPPPTPRPEPRVARPRRAVVPEPVRPPPTPLPVAQELPTRDLDSEVTEAIDIRALRARMTGAQDPSVTQPISVRSLHGLDRHAADADRLPLFPPEEEVSVIVDGPPSDTAETSVEATTYSHVYRDEPEKPHRRIDTPLPVQGRLKTPLPQATPMRRHSRVFGQPLPGSTRYPSSNELPSVGAMPRKSGVYLVPGGPPQRPPHPDPALRGRQETRPRASSPQRYTAPSRPSGQPVAARPRRKTGSYEVTGREPPVKPMGSPPSVRPSPPRASSPVVKPVAPAQSPLARQPAPAPGGRPVRPRDPARPAGAPPRPPSRPPAGAPARPPGGAPPARPPGGAPPRRPTGAPARPPRPPSRDQVVARPVVVVGQPVAPDARSSRTSSPVPRARRASKPAEPSSVFGSDLISERSLDEVILAYLAEDSEGEE